MKKSIALSVLLIATMSSLANPAVDAFSGCLADSTSGKDRKDLARWLFTAMGAHPEMRSIAVLTPSAADDASRSAGQLFTRLLVDACPKQGKEAVQAVGPVAIQSAFSVLGQLAMQELMTDKDVAAGMGLLEKYVDNVRIQAAISTK